VTAVKRIKALTGCDLLDLLSGGLAAESVKRVILSPIAACDVLYAALRPQTEAVGVTDEQFGEALAGEALAFGINALLDEVEFFFEVTQGPAAAKTIAAMRLKKAEAAARIFEKAAARTLAINTQRIVDEAMGSDSSTDSPENSESTPDR
jgi:hypothetical protein